MFSLLILIPYGIICFFTFRYIREYIKTLLNYSPLILFTLVGLLAYFLLITFFAEKFFDKSLIYTIEAIIYAFAILCEFLLIPVLPLTLLLTIIYFIKRKRTTDKSFHSNRPQWKTFWLLFFLQFLFPHSGKRYSFLQGFLIKNIFLERWI